MKKMQYVKLMQKTTAVLLALSLILLGGCAGKNDGETTGTGETTNIVEQKEYSAAPGSLTKSETVYVNMDSSGKVKTVSVSDWLHTDIGEVAVKDLSDLDNIVNIKGDVLPVKNGTALTWNMGTTDLYYSGESKKELPVDISIKYYLDGAEISPEKISGKSGNVKIEIVTENNIKKVATVNGKSVEIYNPMIVVGGMILPHTQFSGTAIENGKLIGDGTKEIALFVGIPGINETLGLDELDLGDFDFNGSFSVTAAADNFSLGNIYFAAIPLSSLGAELNIPTTVDDLKKTLTQLKALESTFSAIDPKNLLSSFIESPDKISGLVSVVDDAVALYKQNRILFDVLPKYLTPENIEAFSKLLTSLDSEEVQDFIKLMSNPVFKNFIKVAPELAENMDAVVPIMEEFSKDMENPEFKAAINALPETLNSLAQIKSQLDENKELTEVLSNLMKEENIDNLKSVLDSIDTSELASTLSEYGDLADNADVLLEKLSLMLDFAEEYDIYSIAPPEAESNVMFVYQTPGIGD